MGLAGSICNRLDIFIIVLVQIDEASPPSSPLNRGAGGERTIHSLMRKQSARGRLMTLRGQKSPSWQMGVNPTPGWGLWRYYSSASSLEQGSDRRWQGYRIA
jgi:hypothetical protein